MPTNQELVELAEQVARAGAAVLRAAWEERRGGLVSAGSMRTVAKSSATDMVTEWDQAAEREIRRQLAACRPGDAVLGEEEGTTPGSTGLRWIVDPLDGTTNFLYGLAPFAVSVAVARDDRVVAGAVADVPHGELFSASRGGGARCNGVPVTASGCGQLGLALVGTGFAYDPDRRALQGEVATALLPQVRDLRRAGAAAVDLCGVACGRLDGFYERGLAEWDLAAGALIAAEAGAWVGGFDGGPPTGAGVLAAAPGIADALRSALVAAGAERA